MGRDTYSALPRPISHWEGGLPLPKPQNVDWTASDSVEGRGDVGSQFLVLLIDLSLRVDA